ncbi:hypothetical protein GCM10007067_03920 [Lysobacter bugurensis]|uniref:Uncharacterized protein n=1 Tax=Cognatilysobacter bugurensis TaxID=543356 RepID=A0A918SWK7_9GAMM|nr:hypothetical protein GCM10007067_03920 [Lysobacter bugurensis]
MGPDALDDLNCAWQTAHPADRRLYGLAHLMLQSSNGHRNSYPDGTKTGRIDGLNPCAHLTKCGGVSANTYRI